MKKDIDILVENFFAPKSAKLNFGALYELIEEQMNLLEKSGLSKKVHPILKEEQTEAKERVIKFPTIKITEKWGEKHNEDRAIFETLMRNLKGDTVESKLANVAEFMEHKAGLSVAEILSHLMFIEIFSNILEEFNPSTAGFLFEAFLAGLFDGVQISDPEGGTLPITDVKLLVKRAFGEDLEVVPYSLKVLSPNSDLKGSFKNLVDHFRVPDETGKMQEHVTYLAVTKEGGTGPVGRLLFYQFEINKDNFFDWIGHEHITDERVLDVVEFTPEKEGTVEGDKLRFGGLLIGQGYSTGKITKDGWAKQPTPAQSTTGTGRITTRRKAYDSLPEEEVTVFFPTSKAIKDPNVSGQTAKFGYGLSYEGERLGPSSPIFSDRTYEITVDTGEKEYVRTGQKTTGHETLYGETVSDWEMLMKNPESFPGYNTKKQWHIAPRYYREMGELVGELDLSEQRLQEVFEAYASNLGESLIALYNALADLSLNINKYFLNSDKDAGMHAIDNATTVKDESENLMQPEETP